MPVVSTLGDLQVLDMMLLPPNLRMGSAGTAACMGTENPGWVGPPLSVAATPEAARARAKGTNRNGDSMIRRSGPARVRTLFVGKR